MKELINPNLNVAFKEEGRLRQRIFRYGTYYDEIIMGLLREEYKKNK